MSAGILALLALTSLGCALCAAGWRRALRQKSHLAAVNAKIASELASARVKLSAGGRARARQRREEEARVREATTQQLRKEIAHG
jgi:hypothetical protein